MNEVFVLVLPDIRRCPRLEFRHWRHHTEEDIGCEEEEDGHDGHHYDDHGDDDHDDDEYRTEKETIRCEDDESKEFKLFIAIF